MSEHFTVAAEERNAIDRLDWYFDGHYPMGWDYRDKLDCIRAIGNALRFPEAMLMLGGIPTRVPRNAEMHANANPALEAKARELLANQLPSERKRAVLLAGRPATYAGGITATQALRAICRALTAQVDTHAERRDVKQARPARVGSAVRVANAPKGSSHG